MNATIHPFPAPSQPFHIVEVYYGPEIGRALMETEAATATFDEAVRIVRDGEHYADRVARIIAADPVAGTCLDVSHKVAEAICAGWDEDDVPSECLQDFLGRHDRLPYWRSDDEPYVDSNAEHRLSAAQLGIGRR